MGICQEWNKEKWTDHWKETQIKYRKKVYDDGMCEELNLGKIKVEKLKWCGKEEGIENGKRKWWR